MINYTSILTDNTDEPEKPKKPIKPKFNQVFKVKEGNFKKNKCSCGCSLKHNNDKK